MVEQPRWASVEGETVCWTGRPSAYPALWTVLKAMGVCAVGLGIWLAGEGYVELGPSMPASSPATLVGSLLVGVGVMGAVTPLLGWVGVGYLVTDESVYRKRGLVFRSVEREDATRIRDVEVTQPLLGELFGYGDVRLVPRADAAETVVIKHVIDPEAVAADIDAQCRS